MVKKTIISILVQLGLIPVFYVVLYAVARIFHTPYDQRGGDGMDFYLMTIIFLVVFVIITLSILNFIQVFLVKNKILAILLHIIWFLLIVWLTQGELSYRPYNFGLILFCIGLTIGTRLVINKKIRLQM